MKQCYITNDVENISINGGVHYEIGYKVWKESMPRLLDLYAQYDVKATFFIVADFAQQFPDVVKMIVQRGHEVASHGLTHDYRQAFDVLNFEEQVFHLCESKNILEDISGHKVVSFRAPALRVNEFTCGALVEAGYLFDSSIAPQRFDSFMSLGVKNKLQWLNAPRDIYSTDISNLARRGNSGIIEVPVSSFVLPYIGTLMRISPSVLKIVRCFLNMEASKDNMKGVNFLIHPSEFVREEGEQIEVLRRSNNYFGHLFSDVLRVKLKQRNLGESAFPLFENELKYWKNKKFTFDTINSVKSVQ